MIAVSVDLTQYFSVTPKWTCAAVLSNLDSDLMRSWTLADSRAKFGLSSKI